MSLFSRFPGIRISRVFVNLYSEPLKAKDARMKNIFNSPAGQGREHVKDKQDGCANSWIMVLGFPIFPVFGRVPRIRDFRDLVPGISRLYKKNLMFEEKHLVCSPIYR